MENNTRELAIKWWNEQSIVFKMDLVGKYYGREDVVNSTGREIQHIFESEALITKEYWFNKFAEELDSISNPEVTSTVINTIYDECIDKYEPIIKHFRDEKPPYDDYDGSCIFKHFQD